jgi:hypothetical protein
MMRTYAVTHSVDLKRHIKEKQMGRPLHKDVNGVKVTRSAAGTQVGIRVEGYFGGALGTDYQLVKQRGKKTFVVLKASVDVLADGDSIAGTVTGTNLKTGVLVSGTPATNGEIRIQGYLSSNSGQAVSLAKLTKRMATDFSGNKYKWRLDNDSSNDYIVLTAV